jgi:subfamily B ATP-binding cassette protein MsbA
MFAIGVVGMTMFAATDAGWAAFVRFFLDGTFVEKDERMVWLVPVALVGLFIVRGVGDFLQTYCPGYVGRRIVKTLRGQIFDRYVHLPVAYFDRNASGVLLSKLTYNTEQVANATTESITVFIRDTLTILGLIGYLLYLNPKLTLFSLIVGPLIAFLIRRINLLFRRYSRRIQASMGDVTRVAKEAIEAPRVIRVFNAQGYEARLFEDVIEHNRRSHMKLMMTKGLSNPIVQTIAATGLAGVLYLATVDAIAGRMTVGEFTSFIAALMLITAAVAKVPSCAKARSASNFATAVWTSAVVTFSAFTFSISATSAFSTSSCFVSPASSAKIVCSEGSRLNPA